MPERILIDIFEWRPLDQEIGCLVKTKVAGFDATEVPIPVLTEIFRIQEMLGRVWETRRIPTINHQGG